MKINSQTAKWFSVQVLALVLGIEMIALATWLLRSFIGVAPAVLLYALDAVLLAAAIALLFLPRRITRWLPRTLDYRLLQRVSGALSLCLVMISILLPGH